MIESLVTEVREEFQIPPYFSDDGIYNYLKEGEHRFRELNPCVKDGDEDSDRTYRMLLKNYVNYAYHHETNTFFENYASLILSWQLGAQR